MLTVDSVIFWLCYVWRASSEGLVVSNLAGVVIVCVNVWDAVQIDSGRGVKSIHFVAGCVGNRRSGRRAIDWQHP